VKYAKESFLFDLSWPGRSILRARDNILEFRITGHYLKTKELGFKKLWDSTHWHWRF